MSEATFKEVSNCLACGSKELYLFLNLGIQPLANALVEDPEQEEAAYPLEVMVCQDCWHSQLSISVSPEVLFSDYSYVSGTTETLKAHFRELAASALDSRERGFYKILDIAANDGSLLEAFHDVSFDPIEAFGIDPAKNLQIESFKKGIPVLVDYWSEELGKKLENSFDIITACNVFAHNLNPLGFLKGCRHALKDDGVLIIEFPYTPKFMLETPTEGQYYHEHQNYFLVKSFLEVATQAGLWITKAEERPIHGGSIRFWLESCERHEGPWVGPNHTVQAFLDEEQRLGLYNLETYRRFANTLKKNWDDLARVLKSYNDQNYLIVGYGASAKSSTLLNGPFKNNLRQAANKVIDFIIDDNGRKVGKFTPGSHIPIYNAQGISNTNCVPSAAKVAHLILTYNFKEEIVEKIKKLRPNSKDDILIEYVPRVKVSPLYDSLPN